MEETPGPSREERTRWSLICSWHDAPTHAAWSQWAATSRAPSLQAAAAVLLPRGLHSPESPGVGVPRGSSTWGFKAWWRRRTALPSSLPRRGSKQGGGSTSTHRCRSCGEERGKKGKSWKKASRLSIYLSRWIKRARLNRAQGMHS